VDKRRTVLPAITRDDTGKVMLLDVSEETDSQPAGVSFAVAPCPDFVERVGGGGDTGQGGDHRRP